MQAKGTRGASLTGGAGFTSASGAAVLKRPVGESGVSSCSAAMTRK